VIVPQNPSSKMKLNQLHLFAIIFLQLVIVTKATELPINPDLLEKSWPAYWVANIEAKHNPRVQGVFLFRKTIELESTQSEFIVHVSADNRYVFYVNGVPVGRGPAQSVPAHWNFETYNIAPFLMPGKNVIAARVWNWGDFMPWAQHSVRTGLIVQGNSDREHIVNTGNSWKQTQDLAWEFFNYTSDEFDHNTGVGPCERIDASKMIQNWNTSEFDDSQWLFAEEMFHGQPAIMGTRGYTWGLTPRITPQMEGSVERLKKVPDGKGLKCRMLFVPAMHPSPFRQIQKQPFCLITKSLQSPFHNLTVDLAVKDHKSK
jgi:alpha-L-rhamnosidase